MTDQTPPNITETAPTWQDRLDAEVLAQARADREKDLELARINSQSITKTEELRVSDAAARRRWRGNALGGLAMVVVTAGIIIAVWTGIDRSQARDVQREQLRQQTAQECIRAGNIWTGAGDCLITQRGAAAPSPR